MIKIEENKLNHQSISKLWSKRQEWFSHDEVDLRNVENIDSSVAAFLVKWAIQCSQRQNKLICYNAPSTLISLINIYKVDGLMEFKNNG